MKPCHGTGAAESPWVPHMRSSISHSKSDSECIRSHNLTKLLCLSPKNVCTREITQLTGSSSHEELNRPGTFWPNITTATLTVGWLNHLLMLMIRLSSSSVDLSISMIIFFTSMLSLFRTSSKRTKKQKRWLKLRERVSSESMLMLILSSFLVLGAQKILRICCITIVGWLSPSTLTPTLSLTLALEPTT